MKKVLVCIACLACLLVGYAWGSRPAPQPVVLAVPDGSATILAVECSEELTVECSEELAERCEK